MGNWFKRGNGQVVSHRIRSALLFALPLAFLVAAWWSLDQWGETPFRTRLRERGAIIGNGRPNVPSVLKPFERLLGSEWFEGFRQVGSVRFLNRPLDDADLELVDHFPCLRSLHLENANITAAGFARLRR